MVDRFVEDGLNQLVSGESLSYRRGFALGIVGRPLPAKADAMERVGHRNGIALRKIRADARKRNQT